MELQALALHNFRNYQDLSTTFSPGVNVFLGPNAQGKTNLLEAIYTLALTRSHRTTTDKELIGWSGDAARINGTISRRTGTLPLELNFSSKGKKAKVNHLDQPKLANYIGNLNVILFAPEDLELVKGAPSVRRQFIDREFSQMSPKYLYVANQYKAILKQRNTFLKQMQSEKQSDLLLLDVLTDQLINLASELIARRLVLLTALNAAAAPIQADITQENEQLEIKYVSQLSPDELTNEESIKNALTNRFEKIRKRELIEGVTKIGPHRDDLQFMVNEHDVAVYGSQGQQRTTALAVKLAEIDLMFQETGEYPILLLDDVLSELDTDRQTHLLTTIQNKVQTFITTPSLSDVAKQLIKTPKIFNVRNGALVEQTDV